MRLQQYLTEKYLDTMENRWGKTAKSPLGINEIFENPTSKEISEISSGGEFCLLVLDKKRVLAFEPWVLHKDVMVFFDIKERAHNPVTLEAKLKGKKLELITSNTMMGSKWFHNPAVADYLRENEWLKKFELQIIYENAKGKLELLYP